MYKDLKDLEQDRIYFKDNPWPEGHPIQEFVWSAKEVNGDIWFDIHLKSADYYAERDIEYDEDKTYPSDWECPLAWGNYHACILSSSYWGDSGFKVCKKADYTPEFLDGLELMVDSKPVSIDNFDDLAFHIYLLGHDAVSNHKIRFERLNRSAQFKVIWTGLIAQAYVGDYEFKYEFWTVISSAQFPVLSGCGT